MDELTKNPEFADFINTNSNFIESLERFIEPPQMEADESDINLNSIMYIFRGWWLTMLMENQDMEKCCPLCGTNMANFSGVPNPN